MNKEQNVSSTTKVKGNILFFYVFDVGEEIDLDKIKKKGLVPVKSVPLSPYFKNYHIPLFFELPEEPKKEEIPAIQGSSCITSKIHNFGVVSFCYKVPFEDSLDELKLKVIDVKKIFDHKSKVDAKITFEKILPTIKKSRFCNLESFYFAIQVDPLRGRISPDDFREDYGEQIATLLRLEMQVLSEYQRNEILAATTAYSGQDFLVVDSEASFIYDDEYFELIELFEFMTIQQLELQYFDRLLDEKLNFFYVEQAFKVPLRAYIPVLGERFNLPISVLAQLRADISVVTERVENSIKMAGDTYFTKVYYILREQLSVDDWRDSINRKLRIIQDIYTVYQDRLDIIHEEILTIVIIVLIAMEAILAFVR
jgi:hypothetical protein